MIAVYDPYLTTFVDTSLFPGANDLLTLESGIANQQPYQVPGFSDVPLTVDVYGATPSVYPEQLPGLGPLSGGGDVIDFTDSIGGPIDFPTARSTGYSDILAGALGLAQSLVDTATLPAEQVPATIPRAGTLSVNAVACPVTYTQGGKIVRQHLRKQQVKARKSPVTQCVTNRHMNSLNPHALRRATRRLSGFMTHVHSAQKALNKALGRHASPIHRRTSRRSGCYTCGRPARSCVC